MCGCVSVCFVYLCGCGAGGCVDMCVGVCEYLWVLFICVCVDVKLVWV